MGFWVWGESLGSFEGLGFEEESWELRRRLEGEKVTVAEILGGGVGGFRREGSASAFEEVEGFNGVLDLGAKKREITCCFCLPIMVMMVVVEMVEEEEVRANYKGRV